MTQTKTKCTACGALIEGIEGEGGLPLGSDFPGELVHDDDDCIGKARKRIEGEREIRTEVNKALEILFRQVNGSRPDVLARYLTARFRTEHRTLQQGLMSALKRLIEDYAEFDPDLRNQDAIEWAQKVKEAGKDAYLRFI
jgi:hypothetical protein